jgi:hypothetical protein
MKFKVGCRVIHMGRGCVGIVEDEYGGNDDAFTDVRWLTPDNVPSCYVSRCYSEDLMVVPPSVVPMPRSRAWHEQTKVFYDSVVGAVKGDEER